MSKVTIDKILGAPLMHSHSSDDVNGVLLLDQTTPQTITGGSPIFKQGITVDSDAYGVIFGDDQDATVKWDNVNSLLNISTGISTGGSTSGQSTINKGLVVNEGGGGEATDDFRAETANEANALVVDASADEILARVKTKIGDDTNYTEIKTDGEINLYGTARVTKDLWIDASGIKAPGSKPATEISFGALETVAWQFSDEGVAANQQTVSWRTAPPYDMDRTVAPIIRIGWSSASTGNCEWQLEYRWLAKDEDCTSPAEETLTATTAASTTSNGLVITTFGGINTPSSSDASIIFRLKRLSAGANDTISDTVELHGACFTYTSNKLGEAI